MSRSAAASAAISSRPELGHVAGSHIEKALPHRDIAPRQHFASPLKGSCVHGLSVVRSDYVLERRITFEEADIAREPIQTSQRMLRNRRVVERQISANKFG